MTGTVRAMTETIAATVTSKELFSRAQASIPGGVNSPVRAFGSVGGYPRFIERGEGPFIYDVDGNRYVDYVGSWGPLILGHSHPVVVERVRRATEHGLSFGAPTSAEVELAEMIVSRVPGIDMVRLVNSGTEATMSAVRLARAATRRDKIIKFDGCYHGHADCFLIAAGSGALTLGEPDSPGVTSGTARDTLVARFNDVESVEHLMEQHGGEIAAVIVEPVGGNAGCIPPVDGFLSGLRDICSASGARLIFDEVMTGFRVAPGGAAERYGVTPDLYTFGKVIGGGMPIGAYAGPRELMRRVAPAGPVYQAGTLSGNPVAVAAGMATLEQLTGEAYERLEALGETLERGIAAMQERHRWPVRFQRVGSMFSLFFRAGEVLRVEDAQDADRERFSRFFHGMLDRGFYLAPSPFEAGFISTVHSPEIIRETLSALEDVLNDVFDSNRNTRSLSRT